MFNQQEMVSENAREQAIFIEANLAKRPDTFQA